MLPSPEVAAVADAWGAHWPGTSWCGIYEEREDAPTLAERQRLVLEATERGEPIVLPLGGERFSWAIPVMVNQKVTGGIVAWVAEADLFPQGIARPRFDVRRACQDLLERAVEANLVNAAQLAAARERHGRERERADFLRGLKRSGAEGVASAWLEEESLLVTAIRAGDRGRARSSVNRILVGIYHRGGGDLERTRAQLVELLVLMGRTAIESGSSRPFVGRDDPVASLAAVQDEVAMAKILRIGVERVFDALEHHRATPAEALAQKALRIISDRCAEDLSRPMLAKAVGVSQPRLTKLLRTATGRGLSDLVQRARIDAARQMLEQTDQDLLTIALAVGFSDASYFTKVFRRQTGMTPSAWRARGG
jgi:AraC-like DNA-binding protein